ncbi:PAS domain S-box protein [Paucibacter sp. APW11]|uniref:PAS domain S-box protein n=1 Tax=Roseateles aquae TaxID=3077235 RepID=A0ABU3P9S1_9BURK|nr:PAS domain S-box protein [Paucibacter sp. APW11]MDT8999318.1 PAS domain S-box protein [Paucibacter sp. APW11]
MPSQLPLLAQDLTALRGLMSDLSDPVLVLGARLEILEANPAAAALGMPAGGGLQALRTAAGSKVLDWLKLATLALAEGKRAPVAPMLALGSGERAQLRLFCLDPDPDDAARWVLHARIEARPAPESGARGGARGSLARRGQTQVLPAATARPHGGVPTSAGHSPEVQNAALASSPTLPAYDEAVESDGLSELVGSAPSWARELIKIFWSSAFPAFVQDAQHKLMAANQAFLNISGRTAAQLSGQDFLDLLAPEDRPAQREAQRGAPSARARSLAPKPAAEFRLVDAAGQQRWMRATLHRISEPRQPLLQLAVLQDCTAEMAAREQAERVQLEMEQWLAISPLPMVLFDEQGLLLRSNRAFEQICLNPPLSLHDALPELQQLLGWLDGRPVAELLKGGITVQTQASLIDAHGRARWWVGRARPLDRSGTGLRRFIAMLEDRSLEQERDLAHQQLDALMDTAGVGLATFQQDAGWLRPRASKSGASKHSGLAGLQGVSRDIVEPGSLAEFERLQKALKKGERVEVRYAVRHPELGRRWLLTRVEPGQLASGQRTTSVVTLDITAQQQAQARSEQLLHELTTIMDSSSLGLAYLRGSRLVRCNPGFAHMLGLSELPAAGTPVAQLFAALPELSRQVAASLPGLSSQNSFDAEFVQVGPSPSPRWLSLSLRGVSAVQVDGDAEVIAVISDISRLKAQQAELETLVQDRELMFSLSDVGIAILRGGRIERANDALAQLTGYRIEELVGLSHEQLFESHGEYERQRTTLHQALSNGGLWRGERRVRRRDGSALWMQVSKRVMRAGAPEEGMIATYVNVDDRWRAQQSLMLQTERERAVLDSVLVGIVTCGRGGIEWMNRSARRMFGGDLVEFAGQPMSIVATPDPNHPFRHTHYLDELTEGQAETFECRLMARDGREFWVVGNAVVTGIAEHGRQLTYALLDIERRRQAEAQTLQAQASLQRIIEAAPLAISLHDAKTLRVEKINQAAAALAGRSEDALMGATPEDMFGVDQGAVIRRDMEAALQLSAVTQREYRLDLHGETRVWDARFLHLSDVALPDGDGEPEQLLLVASDVTEHRAAEEARLQAAIAQRELLVKEVHHRIKNNLQGVAGLLQQIAARRPEVRPVINEAVGQVQAIAQVYGLQVGSQGPLRVKKLVEAITGSVQRMFGRVIHCGVQGPLADEAARWVLPEAESIPIALTLNELLTNALKHSPERDISCMLICEAERVVLRIINPGQLPPGFTLSTVPGGVSGLGLVRALLPRRSARLQLEQLGDEVVCTIELTPPSVTLVESV